jgi:Divergent InlB B-repeat domain/Right handed beta helix region
MNFRILHLASLFCILFAVNAFGTDYYFSSVNGNDANDGLSSGAPKFSESALQDVLDILSPGDNVFLECGSEWLDIDLSMLEINGESGNPVTITSYGTGDAPRLISMKKLGSFNDEGNNIWSITDEQLPVRPQNSFKVLSGGSYSYYNDLNFLLIDGNHYAMAKEPNGDTYFSFEEVAPNYASYAIDKDATWEDDTWDGAHLKIGTRDWISDDVRVRDFKDGTYYLNSADFGGEGYDLHNHNGSWLWIKYLISNHRNAMDMQGEWTYDHASHTLGVYWEENLNDYEVRQSYTDYCLNVSACSYVNIENIEFQGSIMYTVKIEGSDHISFSGCKIKYAPRIALYVDQCTNCVIGNNILRLGTSIGIFNMHGRENTIENNHISNFGCYPSMGGDNDGANKNGIKDHARYGTTIISGNTIDSTGYTGINVAGNSSSAPQAPAHLIVENNDISNFCLVLSDGAGFYIFEDEFTPPNTIQLVSGNIVYNGSLNVDYLASKHSLTMGIYFDGRCVGMNGIGNTVYNTPNGLYTNGTKNTTYRLNKICNVGNVNSRRTGFVGKAAGYGHNGLADVNMTVNSNQIVLYDPESVCGSWLYGSFSANGSMCDSNYYFHPFSTDDLVMNKVINWSATRISLDEWRTITGFDSNSTYNKNGELYSGSSGIEKDQFVKFLVNHDQAEERVVQLHDCVFEDVDGNPVSDSIIIAPRSSEFLFYKAGSPDSLKMIIPDLQNVTDTTVSKQVSLALTVIGSGTVTPGNGLYNRDSLVNLTATPDSGWIFHSWSGDVSSTYNSVDVSMTGDKHIMASFYEVESPASSGDLLRSDGISYYPVPVKDRLTITNTGRESSIAGYMQNGQRVLLRKTYGDDDVHINTQDWTPGIYLFRVSRGGTLLKSFKIVKL